MAKTRIFSLGGLNEVGKNMYIVEVDRNIYVFDAGFKYGYGDVYGVDYILPDFEYLKANIKRIKGLFLSHAHDLNFGAVVDIIKELPDLKVFGSNFTIEILKRRMVNLKHDNLFVLKAHKPVFIGACKVFPINVTHSVPEAFAYALYTDDGIIMYTGDYLFDTNLKGAYRTDLGKLAYVGKQGVLCLLGESTQASQEGFTAPSNRTYNYILNIMKKTDERLLMTVRLDNVARFQEILDAAKVAHKRVILMGNKMISLVNKYIDLGYINFDKKDIGDLRDLDLKNAVVLIENEKGQPFMNLERIIKGYDKFIKIKDSDTFFLSEPSWIGSEREQAQILDELAYLGKDAFELPRSYTEYHASSEDIGMMLSIIKPKYYFPVRGEYQDQVANANIALSYGIPKERIILKTNGEGVVFDNGKLLDKGFKIKIDEILVDGNQAEDLGDVVLKDREVLGENGIFIAAITIAKTKNSLNIDLNTKGFVYYKENEELFEEAKNIIEEIMKAELEKNKKRLDYNEIQSEVRSQLGKLFVKTVSIRPMILTVIQEI